jgi:phosphatidylglycerophosphatase A
MTQAIQLLEEAGCSKDAIIESALALFIPWQRSQDEQNRVVSERISAALLDPTVSSLVCAACFLTLSSKSRQNKSMSTASDVSGQYLGIMVAEHLAGSYAYFEYTRYIKHSPGIIRELEDPYLIHILAGLIAGVTSRLYSEGW